MSCPTCGANHPLDHRWTLVDGMWTKCPDPFHERKAKT